MDLETYRELRTQARRLARNDADAEDLVQETLLAALKAGRADRAWLAGVLQRQAAWAVRAAVRRRRRDAEHGPALGDEPATSAEPAAPSDPAPLFRTMPPAARRVAILALHGLGADEIRWILGITPAAFRQRLTVLRKALGALPAPLQAEALASAYVRDPARSVDLQFGLVRRALKAALRGLPGLATHDADGHLLVLRGHAHTSASRGNE
jgi:DNA-directed RNA polymerase specialized sigma24 family protein